MGENNLLERYRVLKEVFNNQAWEARDQAALGVWVAGTHGLAGSR